MEEIIQEITRRIIYKTLKTLIPARKTIDILQKKQGRGVSHCGVAI
jgi:hypothetical protein